jgi:integrase
MFSPPGSTRENRNRISKRGFATKAEAVEAEAARRIDEQRKLELELCGRSVAQLPTTLSMLLEEFLKQHVDGNLALKTAERYHQQAAYLSPELCAFALKAITPLLLSREWKRLLESGGHHRRTKEARALSKKTVRNVAGVVSSAFKYAIKWGLVATNPVPASEPPVPKKRRGMALTTDQQDALIAAATEPWCLGTYLAVCAATGARRGEILALRWSDIIQDEASITRSLTQTKAGLAFKETKTEKSVRPVCLPASAMEALASHRIRQNEFRSQFGPAYQSDQDLIFANPDGSPLRPDSISASVSALFKRLKLPKGASLHTLRHTHGSHLLAGGMEITAVSERLGHSSVRVTADVYAHAIRGRDREAAKRWEKYQAENATSPKKGVQ